LPAESGAKMRLFVGVGNALHALRAKFPWNHGQLAGRAAVAFSRLVNPMTMIADNAH
jgi:hypothetical protein